MLARIFIDRPVLACVLSVVILLLGGISAGLLPVAEYPEVTPPIVRVSAYYPGANAQVLADAVAAPIEQQVNGVERLTHMASRCTDDGRYTFLLSFDPAADLDLTQVLLQNRVSLAMPSLPAAVQTNGISVRKLSTGPCLVVVLT